MQKVISVFLVALLLLNVMGYYGLFVGLKYKNSLQVINRINADNYRDSETVTIKIPLAVPYFGDSDFERVDGQIEYKGLFYRLVKQKLAKDTLHVVCIRDPKAKHIQEALTEYVKTFSDQSADRSNSKSIHSFIKDYVSTSFSLEASEAGWSILLHHVTVDMSFATRCVTFPSPPPKA